MHVFHSGSFVSDMQCVLNISQAISKYRNVRETVGLIKLFWKLLLVKNPYLQLTHDYTQDLRANRDQTFWLKLCFVEMHDYSGLIIHTLNYNTEEDKVFLLKFYLMFRGEVCGNALWLGQKLYALWNFFSKRRNFSKCVVTEVCALHARNFTLKKKFAR